jgi:hypothetical protein
MMRRQLKAAAAGRRRPGIGNLGAISGPNRSTPKSVVRISFQAGYLEAPADLLVHELKAPQSELWKFHTLSKFGKRGEAARSQMARRPRWFGRPQFDSIQIP